jgi:ferredoxin
VRERSAEPPSGPLLAGPGVLDRDALRALCLAAGADDVGFVEIERPALADQVADITAAFPRPRALIALVQRTAVEAIRSPARSLGNLEFHRTGDEVTETSRRIVAALRDHGVRALAPGAGFPMELEAWPGKIWVIGHKPVAVEAGLGRMGIHRNVIHPRFGTFVLLGTVVVDAAVSGYDRPISFDPCLECKLCVAACPTGAISPTGEFDFSACMTHNYRDFLGGFGDWVETVADAPGAAGYRRSVPDTETVSVWQSLAFGPQYKAAYCVSVCPAGEDVIGPWLEDRRAHLDEVVRPLQDKPEPVYVVPGSDAEAHVRRRFPHKTVRRVRSGIRPATVEGFVTGLPLVFQRGAAAGLDAVVHFRFTGREQREVTVVIRDGALEVADGLQGRADLLVTADAATWTAFLGGRAGLAGALLRRRIRLRGSPRLLRAFARCFPV